MTPNNSNGSACILDSYGLRLVQVCWVMLLVFVHHLPHLLSLLLQSRWQFVVDVSKQVVYVRLRFGTGLLHTAPHLGSYSL